MKALVVILLLVACSASAAWKVDVLYPDKNTTTFAVPDGGMRLKLKSDVYTCFAHPISPVSYELSCVLNYKDGELSNAFSTLASKLKAGLLRLQEWGPEATENTLATLHVLTLYWE